MKFNIKGHLKIKDLDSGEMLVDKPNAIHYGNISTKLAEAFIGKPSSFITYMAFGNAGVVINDDGQLMYREPNVKNIPDALDQLHNTVFVYEISNYLSQSNNIETSTGNGDESYEDIEITIVLDKNNPDMDDMIANGNLVHMDNEYSNTELTFNEIGLYSGEIGLGNISHKDDISSFVNSNNANDPHMITHIVFHPVQKPALRTIEITYILKIQMGN